MMTTATTPATSNNAANAFLDLTGNTQEVENNHVGAGSREVYIRALINFMFFLFDNHRDKLVYTDLLEEAHQQDESSRPRKKTRPKLRKEMKKQLNAMNRREKNPPIHLDGANSITYKEISDFMNTKKNIVDVDKDLAVNFANNSEEASVLSRNTVGETIRVAVRQSDSAYSSIASAIAFLYRQSGCERPEEIKHGLSLYCSGSRRKGKQMKQGLALRLTEGKTKMNIATYKFIARHLFQSAKKEHIFAHLFLVLDW